MSIKGPEGIHTLQPLLPVQLTLRQAYVDAPVAKQLGLSDGQVVQALAEVKPDGLAFKLNGQYFQFPLQPYIKNGDLAQLRAQMLPNGQWILQLLHTGAYAGSELPPTPNTPPSRLRTLLFQPEGFAKWLEILSPGRLERFAPMGHELVRQYLRTRPYMGSVQASDIKRGLETTLRSLESRLIQGESVAVTDPRQLLRTLMLERQRLAPEDEIGQTLLKEAADELDASQVKAVTAHAHGELNLAWVIPFADAEPVHLHFEHAADRPGQPPNPFIVNMHTESRDLGEIWLKTTISPEAIRRRVDLTMWAVRSDVAAFARFNADGLTDEIEAMGMQMGRFDVFNSRRPAPEPLAAPDHGQLVDTRA